MRIFIVILLSLMPLILIRGQVPVGTWSDHLSYNTSNSIAVGNNEVFSSTGSSILVFDKSMAELRKLTRINGLTETGINAIAWSQDYKTLIIGYKSANIDLVINNVIYNIPDIERKYIPGEKLIYRIRIRGKHAYLACSFGIVVIDIEKKEIYDTWKPGAIAGDMKVYDVAFTGGLIYAATDNGVYSGLLSVTGLSYFGNWELVNVLPVPGGRYTSVMFSGEKLYVNLSDPLADGDYVYAVDDQAVLFLYQAGVRNVSFDLSPSGFTISSPRSVKYFDLSGNPVKSLSAYDWGVPSVAQSVEKDGDIWIADKSHGLVKWEKMTILSKLVLPGPSTNKAYNITASGGQVIITNGGTTTSWNNQWNRMKVSIHKENGWTFLESSVISDPLKALVDPRDENHIFISTWGGGLLEYKDNVLVNQFTEANSPLQTIIPDRPYVRICGLAMDDERNLWITQTEVTGNIKVYKPDENRWFYDPGLNIDAPTIGDIIIADNGYKWVILPRGYGLFILDDNKTPENFSDDRSKKMLVEDNDGNVASDVYSIASDLEGNIWVGTSKGPFVYYNPERAFDEGYRAFRIKVPRDDGTNLADYMLGTETITSISVDGANRKWLGTSESGAYLLSPDGTRQLLAFNEKNSPVLSNNVTSMAVDNKTGEVWIGTIYGIQSYRGNATEGSNEFSNVYAFPNPVREDFAGNVTITGLMRDTEIRITDVSGNLVYETLSDGGLATWDLNNLQGSKVSTGVYIIFCSGPERSQSAVTKILVIR